MCTTISARSRQKPLHRLAQISSGLKAAGGGDVASQGTAATLSAQTQLTQGNISQVQSAINQLQAADAAYGELIALGSKRLEVAGRGSRHAGADTHRRSPLNSLATSIGYHMSTQRSMGTALAATLSVDGGAALRYTGIRGP